MNKDIDYKDDDFEYDDYEYDEDYDYYDDLEVYDDLESMDSDFDDDEDDNYHNHDEENYREVVLTLDDDSEITCVVTAQYEIDGQEYIGLLPIEDDEIGEVLIYRASYPDDDDEIFDVELIEDEDEFNLAVDGYYDNVEFDIDEYLEYQNLHQHDHDHHHHHNHHHHLHDDEDIEE